METSSLVPKGGNLMDEMYHQEGKMDLRPFRKISQTESGSKILRLIILLGLLLTLTTSTARAMVFASQKISGTIPPLDNVDSSNFQISSDGAVVV
jgi:hypothetical protein